MAGCGGIDASDVPALLGRLAEGAESPAAWLRSRAERSGTPVNSAEFAAALDGHFSAHPSCQRDAFHIPAARGFEKASAALLAPEEEAIYFCGHSLGLQPKATRKLLDEELDKWARAGVEGHFTGERPWVTIDECVVAKSAAVVGALPSEVAIMNGLTVNLHLLFVAFYQPQGQRRRILYESDCFGSDFHAFESQARLHGLDPKDALLPVAPRAGEALLRTEDIIAAIEAAGETLAVVCLGAVQYFTGQFFDMPEIAAAARKVGASTIAQCAHAAGNVELKLHDWKIDGACWCSYKYLNSGPGGIAGFFIHEMHHGRVAAMPKLAGWWGSSKETRFNMAHAFDPMAGAAAFQLSNPPVLQTIALLASLDVFGHSTMREVCGRSKLLTAYLEALMRSVLDGAGVEISITTPSDPAKRGCALCVQFPEEKLCLSIFEEVSKRGVVIDYRKPNVLRVAPAPLYNNFTDIYRFGRALTAALEVGQNGAAKRARVE